MAMPPLSRLTLLHRGGVGSVPVSSASGSKRESRSNKSEDELPKKKKKKKKKRRLKTVGRKTILGWRTLRTGCVVKCAFR